jgi:hypothetical protein
MKMPPPELREDHDEIAVAEIQPLAAAAAQRVTEYEDVRCQMSDVSMALLLY